MDVLRYDRENSASIAPELGCNVLSWKARGREMLYAPGDFLEKRDPFAGGNPVLFPSVGRTWDRTGRKPVPERYRIAGDSGTYTMPIHGLSAGLSWKRKNGSPGPDTPTAEYTFSFPENVRERHYPFDVDLSLLIEVRSGEISFHVTITSRDDRPAPFAFGFHPYFRISEREKIRVVLPCTERALLDPDLLIPVGEKTLTNREINFGADETWDAAFQGVDGPDARIVADEPSMGVKVTVDEHFEMFVVYSAPDVPFICLEPWTRGIGGYEHLGDEGWERGGHLPVLRPGETRSLAVRYTSEPKE